MQLYTTNRNYMDMWLNNFYHISDLVRLHIRIYYLINPGTDLHADYDKSSFIMFLFNFDVRCMIGENSMIRGRP